jgi:Uma2 family endonuclease
MAGVPEYWIVDLVHDVLIVHRDPVGDTYGTITHQDRGGVQALHHPQLRVDVGDLLR